jgi:pimeloyl-ACP methyl ester carboxylesterase
MAPARRGPIEVVVEGPPSGKPVVMVPSLGRGAEDFDDLSRRLVRAGYRTLRPQPRGIGASVPARSDTSLAELADDLRDVLVALAARPAVLIGHAFGNRVVRMTAVRSPQLVEGLILLAAGGKTRMPPDIEDALVKSFDLSQPDEVRLGYVAKAFFAPGNDPAVWRGGWHRHVAEMQIEATERTKTDLWWSAGAAPILVVQPLQDVLAPPANAEALRREGGDRVTVVYVDHAGHALLPEQPVAVAEAILSYLATIGRAEGP